MQALRKRFSTEVALLALLAAFVASAYGVYAWRDKKEAAFSNLDNLALMSARSSALFFRHFELSLQTLSQDIVATKSGLDSREVHGLLVRFHASDERLVASNLFSIGGESLSSSNLAVGERIADTLRSVTLQTGIKDALDSPGLHIGRPLEGLTGLHEMVIPMRYAFRDESGKPMFVVTAAIPLRKQYEIWQPVALPDGAAIGLLRDDGVLQGRWPEVADPVRVYASPSNGVLLSKLRAEAFPENGRAQGRGTLVDGQRLLAFHRVPGYPLTAYIAIPLSSVWWQWLASVWLPFLLFALMAGCSVWIYRYVSRHRALWEQELQARQIGLQFSNEISAHVMQGQPVDVLIRNVVLETVKHFHGMWCAYSTLDIRGLQQVKESCQPEGGLSLAGRTRDLSLAPVHVAALRALKPVVFSDAASDPVFAPLPGEIPPFRTGSVVNVPLLDPEAVLGVLSVGAYAAHKWSESEVTLLSEIALYLSFSLQESHSKLERENALAQLGESEARFRDLTALSSDWYWEQDENLRFINASAGILQKLGRNPVDMTGKTRRELPGNMASDEEWRAHQAILDARQPFHAFTFKRITPEGETQWVSLSGLPIFDETGVFKGYRGVGKDVTDTKFAEERVEYLAYHDDLTTLANRSSFSRFLNHGIRHAKRDGTGLAVLFLDLDRFKIINDTLGHESGDQLLREVGQRLKECVRQSDTVGRLGGDEFAILLEKLDDSDRGTTVARKILKELARPFNIRGKELRVTTSIGISVYPEHGVDEQTLMKRADTAMYHAKQEGGNNHQFHNAQMDSHSSERATLESSLRGALERGEFHLHYQPKVDIQSGCIIGVEALIRWQHPVLGDISPVRFIPIAEETGLIVPIGQWVLQTACSQNKAWQDEGLPHLRVAVNLSVRQFSHEGLIDDIAATLAETGLKADSLELEITESMIMHNVEKAVRVLNRLKAMGVRLSIDDFGTGYSSLSNLKRFPLNTIKVDRSFIRDIPANADDKAITSAIIAMGRALGLTVIAEGVETREQIDFLREQGCDEFQGYYFSKPVDGRELAGLLRANHRSDSDHPLAA